MYFDFSSILFAATLACGLIALVDMLFWRKKRIQRELEGSKEKEPLFVEYARSFFPVLFLVLVLRAFIVEPFRIPSGSMEPTLNTGDFILVNKFTYGLKWPVIHRTFWPVGKPEQGDVIVFRYPVNPRMDFIKRVIGLPGDEIVYKNKTLYINGMELPKDYIGEATFFDGMGQSVTVTEWNENIFGLEHEIYQRASQGQDIRVTVPDNHYFVMGDNRDDSDDSRGWGFVPEENLVGRAFAIWFSWNGASDNLVDKIRWKRIGKEIQ
jgi:signal peptidase I